jgi:hypothetical protein
MVDGASSHVANMLATMMAMGHMTVSMARDNPSRISGP